MHQKIHANVKASTIDVYSDFKRNQHQNAQCISQPPPYAV